MFRNIIAELDDIADLLENRGAKRLAEKIDVVCNTLQKVKPSRQASQRVATEDLETDGDDEPGRYDAFEAKVEHRYPVGKDSMSKAIGVNLKDIVGRLDFAQDTNDAEGHKINVQASGRQAKDVEVDTGDPLDHFSTAGLEESGDETKNPPLDKNEEGGDLQLFGFAEAGSLHMPGGGKKAAALARDILARVAGDIPVDVTDADCGEPSIEDGPNKGLLGGPDEKFPAQEHGLTASVTAECETCGKAPCECEEADDGKEACEGSTEFASVEIPENKPAPKTASRKASRKLSQIRTVVE